MNHHGGESKWCANSQHLTVSARWDSALVTLTSRFLFDSTYTYQCMYTTKSQPDFCRLCGNQICTMAGPGRVDAFCSDVWSWKVYHTMIHGSATCLCIPFIVTDPSVC